MRAQRVTKATALQVAALHSLFPIYSSRFLDANAVLLEASRRRGSDCLGQLPLIFDERDQRLAWASGILGRTVDSFSALRSDEAATLIDTMKKALGQNITPARRGPDRDQALAYGTAGRRGNSSNEIRLVDSATLELIDRLLAQLGWTQQRFDSFLRSQSSPVRSGAIRTLAEANKVIWALKNMIRRERGNK